MPAPRPVQTVLSRGDRTIGVISATPNAEWDPASFVTRAYGLPPSIARADDDYRPLRLSASPGDGRRGCARADHLLPLESATHGIGRLAGAGDRIWWIVLIIVIAVILVVAGASILILVHWLDHRCGTLRYRCIASYPGLHRLGYRWFGSRPSTVTLTTTTKPNPIPSDRGSPRRCGHPTRALFRVQLLGVRPAPRGAVRAVHRQWVLSQLS